MNFFVVQRFQHTTLGQASFALLLAHAAWPAPHPCAVRSGAATRATSSLHTLQVITGIFIQQTMRVANEDDELLVLQKKRLVESHSKGVPWRELDLCAASKFEVSFWDMCLGPLSGRFKLPLGFLLSPLLLWMFLSAAQNLSLLRLPL